MLRAVAIFVLLLASSALAQSASGASSPAALLTHNSLSTTLTHGIALTDVTVMGPPSCGSR